MSSITYEYTFFKTHPDAFERLTQALKEGLSTDDFKGALKLQKQFEKYEEHVEWFKLTDSKLQFSLMASTTSDVNHALVRAFKEFGCELCHVDLFNDQVGEGAGFYLHRGKTISDEKGESLLDRYYPEHQIKKLIINDVTELSKALDNGLDPNTKLDGYSLLAYAVDRENKAAFDKLLQAGANVNVFAESGLPLVIDLADRMDNDEHGFINTLVEQGADISETNDEGHTFLWCLGCANPTLSRKLRNDGLQFVRPANAYDDDNPFYNLAEAYEHDDIEKMETFYQASLIHLEKQTELAELLCRYDDHVRLTQLIEAGFDPFAGAAGSESTGEDVEYIDDDDEEEERFELLSVATYRPSLSVFNTLQKIADKNNLDYSRSAESLVESLASHKSATDAIRSIISRYPKSASHYALNTAVGEQALENAELLLNSGVSPNQEDEGSLLHEMVEVLSPEMLKLLVKHGANPLDIGFDDDGDEQTALAHAFANDTVRPDTREMFLTLLEESDELEAMLQYVMLDMNNKFMSRWDSMSAKARKQVDIETVLFAAASHNNGVLTRFCIQQGLEAGHCFDGGASAFEIALVSGSHSVVNVLLKNGANPETLINLEALAATAAVFEQGALVTHDTEDDTDANDNSDSILSAIGYSEEMLELDKLVNDPAGLPSTGANGLVFTASQGDAPSLALLLAAKADPDFNSRDDTQQTPLYHAVLNGHTQCVAMLIKAGAKIDAKDVVGFTPVHYAALRGHIDVLQLLLANGAPAEEVSDDEKQTPLLVASATALVRDDNTTISMLLTHGVAVNATDKSKNSALSYACFAGEEKLVAELLANNADVNQVNSGGVTPYDAFRKHQAVPQEFSLEQLKPTSKAVAIKKALYTLKAIVVTLAVAAALYWAIATFISMILAVIISGLYLAWKIVPWAFSKWLAGGSDADGDEDEIPAASKNILSYGLAALGRAQAQAERSQKEDQAIIDSWDDDLEEQVA